MSQVFADTLGSQHTRTLVAARNEQHIKHKIIKLPAQPQELMAANPAAAALTAPGASKPTAPTIAARGQQAAPALIRGAAGAAAITARQQSRRNAADSDLEGSSSSSDDDAAFKHSKRGAQLGGQRQGRKPLKPGGGGKSISKGGPRAGTSSSASSRGVQQHMGSMQERLQATMQSRQHKEERAAAALAGSGQHAEARDYTDPDHLGAGVFRATPVAAAAV